MKISTILDKIDEKQLFVPAFQREYVWKRDDAKQLLDSLIKDYPTGTMLTWETSNPPELKGPYQYDEKQGSVRLLLDGQQRVTTLYMLIKGDIPPYYTLPEITNDTRGLYVNLDTLELSYYMKTRMEKNPLWQNITDVFQRKVDAFSLSDGDEIPRDLLKKLNTNINTITQILDREFPEQTIPVKATIREAIDIFYKVNASGVALTDAELALAQISGYWPQARDLFKEKINKLAAQGFVFKLDFMVYCLLACMYNMGSDMRKLHGMENSEKIKEAWKKLDTKVLDYVMNILKTHAYVDHTQEINSVYALIPIISYCYKRDGEGIGGEQIKRMIKWFYYSQIRARYISQLGQKLDIDLRVVAEAERPFENLLNSIAEERPLEITPDEFVGRTVSSPLFGLVRWYLKSRDAVCLTTGVGLRQNMGEKYKLENDHIFPTAKLKNAGYARGNRLKYALAQELTNRAVLTQLANRKKSDTATKDYLTAVKEKYPEALKLQCIPENDELWEIENYEEFLAERRKVLAANLNKFLNKLTTNEEDIAVPATLEEIIAEGESEDLEFKSTLRWDLNQGCVNKKLEDVIVKTIAAFANSDGGTLLIGVNDDGEAIGLENDYASLNADKDKFELHLRNILNQKTSETFVAKKVSIKFPVINDIEICQVDVTGSREPVIVELKDNNGQSQEKLFVRSGNSSQEIPLSQMAQFLTDK